LCVPAHINRGSSGVLNALGFLPADAQYDALEISRAVPMPPMDLSGYRLLESSDAHYLENMLEPMFFVEAGERSADALFDAIKGKII
ncbi:MAG: phosphoesterase, partial [Clostridia bacterium]|nr:phosphoesterase [Clostridia bacterium]